MVNRRFCFIVFVLALVVSMLGIRGFLVFGEPKRSVAADANAVSGATEIAKQQVAIANQALRELEQLQKIGAIGKLDDTLDVWWRRLIESLRNGGGDEAALTQALKDYVEHTKANLRDTEAFRKTGQTSQMQLYDAKYQALEAESWLAEAQEK